MVVVPAETLVNLRAYYEHAELTLPEPYPHWHQFRVQLPNGHFLRIKDTIHTQSDLHKWLERLTPLHCYASVNTFLSPSGVSHGEFNGKKAGWNHSNNILIGDGVLAFDVDFHNRSFAEAKRDALVVVEYMKAWGYDARVHFSGSGFHIIIQNHDLHLSRSYSSRNMQNVFVEYRRLREPILDELEAKGVRLDRETTLDAKRILRVCGTVNMKTGSICTRLNDVESFEEVDAERLRLEGVTPLNQNRTGDDRLSPAENDACDPVWRKGGSTNQPETKPDEMNPANPTLYLSTLVIGTDRQVILLSFPKDSDVQKLQKHLSRFAEQEQLAPFLLFKSKKDPATLYALSPTAIQTQSMKRLLKRFQQDRTAYLKFRRRIVPLPIMPLIASEGRVDTERPVSRAFFLYLQHYGLADWIPRVICGANMLPTLIGEMPQ